MVRITNEIDIDAPTHDVYLAVKALDAYPIWLRRSVVYRGTKIKATRAGASITYEDSTTVGRMPGELVEDLPDHTLRFHQSKPSGSLDALIRYDLTAAGTGTHVTRVGDMTTHGILRAMQPILLRMASAESKRTMEALKSHAERKN
jgi:uncharacterized protein YndB with AHSA1/START domain